MRYVLYHSSIEQETSVFEKLRQHARDGQVMGEYFDPLKPSGPEHRPELEKALQECKENDAMLLIMDLAVVGGDDKPIKNQGIKLKILT